MSRAWDPQTTSDLFGVSRSWVALLPFRTSGALTAKLLLPLSPLFISYHLLDNYGMPWKVVIITSTLQIQNQTQRMGTWQIRDSNPNLPSSTFFLSTMSLLAIKDVPSWVMSSTLLSLAGRGEKIANSHQFIIQIAGYRCVGCGRQRGQERILLQISCFQTYKKQLKGKSCHFLF